MNPSNGFPGPLTLLPSAAGFHLSHHFDIKVKRLFRFCSGHAQALVEFDGRKVFTVGLNKNDLGSKAMSDLAQLPNQLPSDAATAKRLGNSEIVEINLAGLLLDLFKLIGNQAANNLRVSGGLRLDRCDRDELRLSQKPPQVGVARRTR